jgi:hypothetical protein
VSGPGLPRECHSEPGPTPHDRDSSVGRAGPKPEAGHGGDPPGSIDHDPTHVFALVLIGAPDRARMTIGNLRKIALFVVLTVSPKEILFLCSRWYLSQGTSPYSCTSYLFLVYATTGDI